MSKTAEWTTCTIDISDLRESSGWGSLGDVLKFDFECETGATIVIRHLRICKGDDDPWEPTTYMPADVASILNLGLPVLDIETVDNEEPTCDYVSHPSGSFGSGITNATKVPGKLDIYLSDSATPDYSSGEYQKDESGMTIKVRGNTSAYADKKPFKIKLQKKANLMLQGKDKTFKDKDWVLLRAPYLFTPIGFKIGEMMGLQWTPRCRYVNVIFNGDYRGMYLLAESVKRNEDARLNVSADGYIFELDPYWWNEDGQYVLSKFNPQCNYTFKYPDWEDMDAAKVDYIQNVVTTYESAIAQGDYTKYIDVESYASWLLVHDLFGTWDGAGCNMYFTKYDSSDASLIRMANVWDFDTAEQMDDAWSGVHNYHFNQFFNSANKEFARQYVMKWNEIKDSFFTDILTFIDDFAESDEGKGYSKSVTYDNIRWDSNYSGLSSDVAQHRQWFDRRKSWLSQAMTKIDTGVSSIKEQNVDNSGLRLYADGVAIHIVSPRTVSSIEVFDVTGRCVYKGTDATININNSGVYIVRVGGQSGRVMVK